MHIYAKLAVGGDGGFATRIMGVASLHIAEVLHPVGGELAHAGEIADAKFGEIGVRNICG